MNAEEVKSALCHTIKGACQILHISPPTIYAEINSGRLKTFTVGRRRFVSQSALQDWIRAREAEANHAA